MSNSNKNWPSKTEGRPSGGNRDNNPPKTSGNGSKPSTSKK
ncbi:hypothetical protein [Chryseobacterium sp. Y16C]|nr:hypothetical protein [Chryseobacterium sp. Y16C]